MQPFVEESELTVEQNDISYHQFDDEIELDNHEASFINNIQEEEATLTPERELHPFSLIKSAQLTQCSRR
jgi:hypothetical protein